MSFPFNIRVYGLLINDKQQVLVTDEWRNGMAMTKFPGGGLEFGEGTLDCLKRELREELNYEAGLLTHFYTTDFFQPSAFNPKHQLISIYYIVRTGNSLSVRTTSVKFDFSSQKIEGEQLFRWLDLAGISPQDFTFPVDQHVAILLQRFSSAVEVK